MARCASTATPASNSTRGWPTASTDGSGKHRLCCPSGGQLVNPNRSAPRREVLLCFRELVGASSTSVCLVFVTLHFHSQAAKAGIAIAASAQTVRLLLLQQGAFVLHLGVEHESRSIRALTAAAQQKR